MNKQSATLTMKNLSSRIKLALDANEIDPFAVAETSAYYVDALINNLNENEAEIILKTDKRLQKMIDQMTSHCVNAALCLGASVEQVVESLNPGKLADLRASTPYEISQYMDSVTEQADSATRWLSLLNKVSTLARANCLHRRNTLEVVASRISVMHDLGYESAVGDNA
ncbi:hypothetical protein R21Y_6 [Vibrio phage vB_VhaS_R21Y]|nr:hypothetical protein R21Y_6 [Vibrio phage vB_VhaS_R21Y]